MGLGTSSSELPGQLLKVLRKGYNLFILHPLPQRWLPATVYYTKTTFACICVKRFIWNTREKLLPLFNKARVVIVRDKKKLWSGGFQVEGFNMLPRKGT